MSRRTFLKEEKHTFSIAKLAVFVQSFLTSVIGTLLIFEIIDVPYSEYFLKVALTVNILFVCTHISYRLMYRGPKIHISRLERNILMTHIIASLGALISTAYIFLQGIDVVYGWICVILASWVVSLVSGILFFIKKYKHKMVL